MLPQDPGAGPPGPSPFRARIPGPQPDPPLDPGFQNPSPSSLRPRIQAPQPLPPQPQESKSFSFRVLDQPGSAYLKPQSHTLDTSSSNSLQFPGLRGSHMDLRTTPVIKRHCSDEHFPCGPARGQQGRAGLVVSSRIASPQWSLTS